MRNSSSQTGIQNRPETKETGTFFVDVPNWVEPEGEWKNIEIFTKHEEALEFVQRVFGADKDGKVSLVSFVEGDNVNWEKRAKEALNELLEGAVVADDTVSIDRVEYTDLSELSDGLFWALEDLYNEVDPKEPFNDDEIDTWIEAALRSSGGKLQNVPTGRTAKGEGGDE